MKLVDDARRPPVADPEPALPDLTEASPLDGGRALPPSEPVPSAPEPGASRLGAGPPVTSSTASKQ